MCKGDTPLTNKTITFAGSYHTALYGKYMEPTKERVSRVDVSLHRAAIHRKNGP